MHMDKAIYEDAAFCLYEQITPISFLTRETSVFNKLPEQTNIDFE